MSDNGNWANLGEQFLDSVTDALNTGDFSGVNNLLSETVSGALLEARYQAFKEKERQKEKVQWQYDHWQQGREERSREDRERREAWLKDQERQIQKLRDMQKQHGQMSRDQIIRNAREQQASRTQKQVVKDMRTMIKSKKVGSVSSILYLISGILGITAGALNLVPGMVSLLIAGSGLGKVITGAVLTAGAVFLLDRGSRQRARLERSERYIHVCGYKMYGMLEDMAKQTGKSLRYVRRDLKKMLKMGFFPEGHLDDQETCFMLNDTVYQQYQQTMAAYRQAEADAKRTEEAARMPGSPAEQAAEEKRAQEAELNAMVSEGREYIRKLRELNDEIPGEPISAKLYQLENLLNEIFDCVKEHPEQMHRMHKLMEYYLPTTLKLVEAYKEFGEVSVPGEDILSAMAEIEKTLDAINLAFKELLNELFQDAALDVTTDAQVLQTMLAREGLTREMEPLAMSAGLSADSQTEENVLATK